MSNLFPIPPALLGSAYEPHQPLLRAQAIGSAIKHLFDLAAKTELDTPADTDALTRELEDVARAAADSAGKIRVLNQSNPAALNYLQKVFEACEESKKKLSNIKEDLQKAAKKAHQESLDDQTCRTILTKPRQPADQFSQKALQLLKDAANQFQAATSSFNAGKSAVKNNPSVFSKSSSDLHKNVESLFKLFQSQRDNNNALVSHADVKKARETHMPRLSRPADEASLKKWQQDCLAFLDKCQHTCHDSLQKVSDYHTKARNLELELAKLKK